MAEDVQKIGFNFIFNVDKSTAEKLASIWSQVSKGMEKAASDETSGKMSKNIGAASKGMEKAGISALAMTKALVVAQIAMNAINGFARSFMSTLLTQMPIIGQAFEAMKTVIMRNLVWPIANAVLPILIDMLNWVRENRLGFAMIGHVIAGAFKLAISIVKIFVGTIGKLFAALGVHIGTSQQAFGKFVQFLNFLLLKIAFIFTFISILIEPLLVGIGKLVKNLFVNIWLPYAQAAFSSFMDLFEAVAGFVTEIGLLIGLMGDENLANFTQFFKTLGKIVGIIVFGPLTMLIKGLTALIKFIRILATSKNDLDLFKKLREGFPDIAAMWDASKSAISSAVQWMKSRLRSIWDGFTDGLTSIGSKVIDAIMNPFKAIKDLIGLIGEKLASLTAPQWLKDIANKGMEFLGLSEPAGALPSGAGSSGGSGGIVTQSNQNTFQVNGAQNPQVTAETINKIMTTQHVNYAEALRQATRGR